MSGLLQVEIHGDLERPPIVFLHGFLGRGSDWLEIATCLHDEFCCGWIDLPGHGASIRLPSPGDYNLAAAAAAVTVAVRTAGLKSPALVGYSMGGRVALRALAEAPEAYSAAVIESAHPGLECQAEREERLAADERTAGRIETEPLPDFVKAWYGQPLFQSLRRQPDRLDALVRGRCREDPRELARGLRGLSLGRQPPMWDLLATLPMPLLWVAGAMDGTYAALAERAAGRNRLASLLQVADAGHNVHAEQPWTFATAIRTFLGRPPRDDQPPQ
jgi:2-succinyl-6-hydroxy-2,4-cyclohexadiene-1-carboxylate synthase